MVWILAEGIYFIANSLWTGHVLWAKNRKENGKIKEEGERNEEFGGWAWEQKQRGHYMACQAKQ